MAKAPQEGKRSRKLSEIVAAQLMEEIRGRDWPTGESLGTEAELMARYQVSRATVAEAVRQIERYGAAVMRRGSGGGLVVTNSARFALARTISTYLELANTSLTEHYEASALIEVEAARLAALNTSDEQAAELRNAVIGLGQLDDHIAFHRAAMQLRIRIAELSNSRPVILYMRALARILTHYVRPDLRGQLRDRAFEHSVLADLAGIVEAIVAGDPDTAIQLARQDVERRAARARQLAAAHPRLESGPLRRDTPHKLAEKVAYAIRDDIANTGWQTGSRLGDEAELPGRYGVSHWVLRQAIRILEPSGIVQMRRGQGGGLYIGRPAPEHTIETAVSYLAAYQQSHAQPLDDYRALYRALFRSMARMAANRSIESERDELLALAGQIAGGGAAGVEAHSRYWRQLAQMARNHVLELFATLAGRFIADNLDSEVWQEANPELLVKAAEAISEGDAPQAHRHIGNYLES